MEPPGQQVPRPLHPGQGQLTPTENPNTPSDSNVPKTSSGSHIQSHPSAQARRRVGQVGWPMLPPRLGQERAPGTRASCQGLKVVELAQGEVAPGWPPRVI